MGESGHISGTNAGGGNILKQDECIPSQQARATSGWRRTAIDALLASAGVALVTALMAIVHLYPRLPSIVLIYLLVIIVLARARGIYAATMGAVLASIFFDFFFTPPLYEFSLIDLTADDLLDPWILLVTGIVAGRLIVTLQRRVLRARHQEQEARRLSQQAQQLAALQERRRLARELHDSISQALYGINLGTRTAREALDSDPGEAIAPLEYVIALAEASLAEMQALIFELRPEFLATEGLVAALTRQADVLRARYKLSVDIQLCKEPTLPLEDKHTLYRIAQEALHNIVKHAYASMVALRLANQDDELILEVCDDGEGFDPTGLYPGHLGLRSIQERVAQLSGTCSIESAPEQGTRLCVRIPIP